MAKNKDNILSQIGWEGLPNEEYINTYDLDPTADINQQMFMKVEDMNTNGFMEKGMTEDKARAKARSMRLKGMKAAKQFGKIEL